MRRIHVCGTSGSGKTTLARALAEKLRYPHVELDALYHGPNWTPAETEVFIERVSDATDGHCWVADGNYTKVRDLLWSRVDTIVWLDYPLPLVLWRLTRRTFRRSFKREVLWNGNREVLWKHLFVPKDSLYWWVLKTHGKRKRQLAEAMADPAKSHITFIVHKSPDSADDWLNRVTAE